MTNLAAAIALKLTCPLDPGDNTVIRGQGATSQGRNVPGATTILGTCPAPIAGVSDITGLYTAKYGQPAPSNKDATPESIVASHAK